MNVVIVESAAKAKTINKYPNLGCRCFTHSTETLLWATKAPKGSKHKYTFHYQDMKAENGGKQMKSVWQFPAAPRKEKLHGKHPTQKPVALIDRCLRASTNPGDTVFDPFAGSASTGVAALPIGRVFIGCDIDGEYTSIGSNRLSEIVHIDNKAVTSDSTPLPSSEQKRLLERAQAYHSAAD